MINSLRYAVFDPENMDQTTDKVCRHLDFLHTSEPSKHSVVLRGLKKAAARHFVTPSSTADLPHLGPPYQSVI